MIVASRLRPKWKFIWGRTDAEVRRHVGPFIAYLNERGIDPNEVTQSDFDDWLKTRAELTANSVGHFNTVVHAWGKLRGLDGRPLPPIERLKNIYDRRAEQNEAIDPGIRREIFDYRSYLAETGMHKDTVAAIERRLLDGGRILTEQGWSEGSFAAAFATDPAAKRFVAWFEPDPTRRTAISRRRRIMGDIRDLLLQAREYEAYERLKRYFGSLPKPGNELAEKTLDRITAADASAVLEESVAVILEARDNPTAHTLASARGGLAILAVSAESCRRRELATLGFKGPERTFGRIMRPALAFESHRGDGLVDLEDDGTVDESSLSILATAYWTAARILHRRAPCLIFENEDGSPQNPSTITNAVTRETKRAGVALSPTDAIALNVDALFEKCDLQDWEIADLLRYSGQTNFRMRFRLLQQRRAAARAAGQPGEDT